MNLGFGAVVLEACSIGVDLEIQQKSGIISTSRCATHHDRYMYIQPTELFAPAAKISSGWNDIDDSLRDENALNERG